MLRCTLASRGSSRSLHNSKRTAFAVVLMGSVHLMKLFRDFRRGTTPRCPLSGCLSSIVCRVRSVRLATALLMSDGAIPASMGRLLMLVGFRQPVIIRQVEDGYEKRLINGAVFVDLSADCDTVNHRRLLSKALEMTGDVHLTDLIRTMLESRRFFVVLDGKKSRWRRQRNGNQEIRKSGNVYLSQKYIVNIIQMLHLVRCTHDRMDFLNET